MPRSQVSKTPLPTDYKNFTVDPVEIVFGKLVILQNTKLVIAHQEHYGLMGKNGVGKTSLFNAIANRTLPIPEKLDMIYVRQEEAESDRTIIETLLSADERVYKLHQRLAELETLVSEPDIDQELIDEYNEVSQELGSEHLKAKARAQKILHGLGFDQNDQNRAVSEFSGGWRMRIALAKALFMTPTLLLLDEPTNHLDLSAVLWLTDYLRTYPKTLIVVSHDKYFIDEVCTTIIHIHDKKLNYYHGNYDQFQSQLQLEKTKAQKDWNLFQKKIEAMHKSQKSKDQIDEYIKSVKISKPEKDFTIRIKFIEPTLIKGTFLSLENITFGYENKLIYHNLNFNLCAHSKIAIVGRNGIGKSTLLKLIYGSLKASSGEIYYPSVMRMAYYHQHFEESMPYGLNGVEYLLDLNHEISLTTAHQYLSLFGLEGQYHKTKIGQLSGGQKARVKLASFGVYRPHLLLLDEPTNHLDLDAIESLIHALQKYEGAIVLVTHNFDLITRIQAELWVVSPVPDRRQDLAPAGVSQTCLYRYPKDYQDYVDEIVAEIS